MQMNRSTETATLAGDREAAPWMVVAIIQPFKLDRVTLALEAIPDFAGLTVTDCRGFGRGKVHDEPADQEAGRREASQGGRPSGWGSSPLDPGQGVVDFTPKLRLEVVVATRPSAETVMETIAEAAHTGRRGDGTIFLLRVADVLRIRTLDRGTIAV